MLRTVQEFLGLDFLVCSVYILTCIFVCLLLTCQSGVWLKLKMMKMFYFYISRQKFSSIAANIMCNFPYIKTKLILCY